MQDQQPQQDTLYQGYDRNLYKAGSDDVIEDQIEAIGGNPGANNSTAVNVPSETAGSGQTTAMANYPGGGITSGKQSFTDPTEGFFIAVDTDGTAKINIGDSGSSLMWDGPNFTMTTDTPGSPGGAIKIIGGGGSFETDLEPGTINFLSSGTLGATIEAFPNSNILIFEVGDGTQANTVGLEFLETSPGNGEFFPETHLTTQVFTFTGSLSMGATSGTLNALWTAPTGNYSTTFSNGNIRSALFTNGSLTVAWVAGGGLSSSATANISVALVPHLDVINLGDASSYFNEINYKTLTDRGCLGWFDEGVEMRDGTRMPDTKALLSIQRHPTRKTVYGVDMMDYSSMPKAVYKAAPVATEDVVHPKTGEVRFRKGEKMGEDGAETTALISIMIGAIKELSLRVEQLESSIKSNGAII